MGKAASRFTQALGIGGGNGVNTGEGFEGPIGPKPPQWDTEIDQVFGDAPLDDNGFDPPPILDVPMRPKKRRRPPPPPPSLHNRGRRRPLPSSPLGRRRHRQGGTHALRTPIVPDMPRRVARGGVHAINAPFGVNRRPMVLPVPRSEREMPARIALSSSFNRRPSNRRRR
jgi:hypothetical protein